MKGGLIIIIVIAIVAFIIDALTNRCIQQNAQAAVIILLHHFIFVYALLGWLLDDFAALVVYVSLPVIVHLHWKTNKNRCFIDQVTSSICGKETSFNHLGKQLHLNNSVVTTLVLIGICIGLYKIYRILKCKPKGPPPSVPPPWCNSKKCRKNTNTCSLSYITTEQCRE